MYSFEYGICCSDFCFLFYMLETNMKVVVLLTSGRTN